jgi:hypothetical protein
LVVKLPIAAMAAKSTVRESSQVTITSPVIPAGSVTLVHRITASVSGSPLATPWSPRRPARTFRS